MPSERKRTSPLCSPPFPLYTDGDGELLKESIFDLDVRSNYCSKTMAKPPEETRITTALVVNMSTVKRNGKHSLVPLKQQGMVRHCHHNLLDTVQAQNFSVSC